MKKVILLHNFKCGGTTIRQAFKDQLVFDILPKSTTINIDNILKHEVIHAHQANGAELTLLNRLISRLGLEKVKNDFLFIITIRNPINLIGSFYRWGIYKNHGFWFGIFPPYIRLLNTNKIDAFEIERHTPNFALSRNYNQELLSSHQEKSFNDVVNGYITYFSQNKQSNQTVRRKNLIDAPSLYFSDPRQGSKIIDTFDNLFLKKDQSLLETNKKISISYTGQQCNRFAESLGVTPLYFVNTFSNCVFVDTEIQDSIMAQLLKRHPYIKHYFKDSYLQSLLNNNTTHMANKNPISQKLRLSLANQIKYYSNFPDDFTFWESCMRHTFDNLFQPRP